MKASRVIQQQARDMEPDRATAALFAPAAVRDDLIVLAAYLGDVARIPLTVSDPALGEIRLQWWRDALSAGAQGERTGNPVADDMIRVISRHGLSLGDVLAPLDARSFELQDGGGIDVQPDDFEAYLEDAEGSAVRMTAAILTTTAPDTSTRANTVRSYALIRLALRLPLLVAKDRWPVPMAYTDGQDPRQRPETEARDIMAAATGRLVREAVNGMTHPASAADLVAALVPTYAKALSKPGRDPLLNVADISPLTRFMRLWLASKRINA